MITVNLTDIPNLASLTELKHLQMSGNTHLGVRIENANLNVRKDLKTLILRNCDLEKLPLYCLSHVEHLDVSCNQIKTIKGTFIAKKLKHLQIVDNPITELEIRSYSFPLFRKDGIRIQGHSVYWDGTSQENGS